LFLGSDMLEPSVRLLYLIGEPGPAHERFISWAEREIPGIEIAKFSTSHEASLHLNQISAPEKKRIVVYRLGLPDQVSVTTFSSSSQQIVDAFGYKLIICETLLSDSPSDPGTAEEFMNNLFVPPCIIAYSKHIMSEGFIPAFIYRLTFAVLSGTKIGGTDVAEFLRADPPSWGILFTQLRVPLSTGSFHALPNCSPDRNYL
jgi:hypothetical protein